MTDDTEVEVLESTAAVYEERLTEIRNLLVEIDARRAPLIQERDDLMRALSDPPYLRSTRRLAALGGGTHSNVALIVKKR